MAYRSDVRIITSKKGYNELKKYVDTYLKTIDKDYNLLDNCDVFKHDDEEYYFGWDSIVWYGYEEIIAIEEGIKYLEKNDFSYRISMLGESYGDYEERSQDGKKDKVLSYIPVSRYFNDDEIIYFQQEKTIASPKLEVVT